MSTTLAETPTIIVSNGFWTLSPDLELTQHQRDALATILAQEQQIRYTMDQRFKGMMMAGMLVPGYWHELVEPTAEQYEQGLQGLMQFYAAHVLYNGELAIPGEAPDAAWHGHQLYSEPYREFCLAAFGKFLDHFPLDRSDVVAVEYLSSLVVKTAAVFAQMFVGQTPFTALGIDFGRELTSDQRTKLVEHCCYCR